eukprot:3293155-Rhodomonas_salina.1
MNHSGAGNAPPSKQREAKEGKKKVLIVMSHTGGGHLASAKAITAGLEELNTACLLYTSDAADDM